jgi:hypothetical protein
MSPLSFAKVGLLAAWIGSAFAAPSASSAPVDKRYIETRDDITYNVFEHAATGTKMSFVNNSGICETTAGVNQYSGYITVGTGMNMWFWYVINSTFRACFLQMLMSLGFSRPATARALLRSLLGSTAARDAAP